MELLIYFIGLILAIIGIGIINTYINVPTQRISIFFCIGSFGIFICLILIGIGYFILIVSKKIPDSILFPTFSRKKK